MLETGEPAPDFELPNQANQSVNLSDYEGRTVVLYFYPMADTPDCTQEAKAFRDDYDEFEDRDIVVLGVSTDGLEDVRSFHGDHDLPFDLLSDADGGVSRAYETYGEPEMGGDVYEIAYRHTYVIDENGTIAAVYEDVTPETHAQEVLDDIEATA